jgi:acetyl esterase/lipase
MLSDVSKQVRDMVVKQYAAFNDNTLPIEVMRQGMEQAMAAIPLLPGLETEKVSLNSVPGEWVRMPGVATDKVLLFLHGGAYTMGSIPTYRDLASRLSQASGVQVLLVDYRLAPEHPYPAAIEDALKAYNWLLHNGFAPSQIAIGGDSAGGGLTLATLLSIRQAGDGPLPAAAILLSPWADLSNSGESYTSRASVDPVIKPGDDTRHIKDYARAHNVRNPLISPVYANLQNLPPLMIHVGNDEVLLDDSTRVAKNAKAAGIEVQLKVWEDMWHVFQAYAMMLPEAQQSINELGAFVHSKLF